MSYSRLIEVFFTQSSTRRLSDTVHNACSHQNDVNLFSLTLWISSTLICWGIENMRKSSWYTVRIQPTFLLHISLHFVRQFNFGPFVPNVQNSSDVVWASDMYSRFEAKLFCEKCANVTNAFLMIMILQIKLKSLRNWFLDCCYCCFSLPINSISPSLFFSHTFSHSRFSPIFPSTFLIASLFILPSHRLFARQKSHRSSQPFLTPSHLPFVPLTRFCSHS